MKGYFLEGNKTQYNQTNFTPDRLSSNIFIITAGMLAFLLITALALLALQFIFGKYCGSVIPTATQDIPMESFTDLDLTLQKVIGNGDSRFVWAGTFQRLHTAAVKIFPISQKREFDIEKNVYLLPLMKHPGIVQFLGAGKLQNNYALVLELATEGSLNAFLSRNKIDWRCAVKLAKTLSQGLAYLHADFQNDGLHKPMVAHGDLSSSNVLVKADGSCALCDFGCSTVSLHKRQTLLAQCNIAKRATLRYLAPEILDGYVNLKSFHSFLQADMYSLGLLLWELMMRCSDLINDSPVPEHLLPFEMELGSNPSWEDLVAFVCKKQLRPTIPHLWETVSTILDSGPANDQMEPGWSLSEILEDCWDQDEDARLTAQCAADRLASLPSDLY